MEDIYLSTTIGEAFRQMKKEELERLQKTLLKHIKSEDGGNDGGVQKLLGLLEEHCRSISMK